MSITAGPGAFLDALGAVRDVAGWLSDTQARRLWDAAGRVSNGGCIVEIGSFRGRSTIVLARSAGPGVGVVAIDPHRGGDRGPNQIRPNQERGESDHAVFVANLDRARVLDRVRHVRKPSSEAIGDVTVEIDMLYIDGAHRYVPARDDIAAWGAKVAPGGSLLIHDSFNAVGVTLAQLRLLVPGKQFAYVGRSGSLSEYRREPLAGSARIENAARQLAQLPYFVRMISVKAALTANAYPVARALGHDTVDWPY